MFDRRLVNPSWQDLERTVQEAFATLEATGEGYGRPGPEWLSRLRFRRGEFPTDWLTWTSLAPLDGPLYHLVVAWWVDLVQRSQVRVALYRTLLGDRWDFPYQWYSTLPDLALPWVFPESNVYAGRGRSSPVLALCDCGLAGEPHTLAWMGRRCGPCHDRVEADEPDPGYLPARLLSTEQTLGHLTCSPAGTALGWVEANRGIQRLDLHSGARRTLSDLLPVWCCFAPDGEGMIVPLEGKVLEVRPGVRPRTLTRLATPAQWWLYARAEGCFGVLSAQEGLVVCDLDRPRNKQVVRLGDRRDQPDYLGLALSPQGRQAIVQESGCVRWFDVARGREPGRLYLQVWSVAWAGNARTVALLVDDGSLLLWDGSNPPRELARATRLLRPRNDLSPGSAGICFSPDGRKLAGLDSSTGALLVWEVDSGRLLPELAGHQSGGSGLLSTPSGHLVSSDRASNIRVWPTGAWRFG
jgi:hypothetical protein